MNDKNTVTPAHGEKTAPHGHQHPHGQNRRHCHGEREGRHGHAAPPCPNTAWPWPGTTRRPLLALRSHSGLSGDMFIAAFASLLCMERGMAPDGEKAAAWLDALSGSIMPELAGKAKLRRRMVNGVGGWQAEIALPKTHEHRALADITEIIQKAGIQEPARQLALACFRLLADAEASVHYISPEDVHFHEVGALDSILDICMTCELYCQLGKPLIVSSPLPLADGQIKCAHGILPAPAPAVLKLLADMPVRPFSGAIDSGELVTPTGAALLKAFDPVFGPWPQFRISSTTTAYGQKTFPDAANGLVAAIGRA